ncbi:hypothetical protein B0H14DRAFT_490340 [Mycena olivaceomarginata]|nr:hypothetical protein B0H14DRAFT_490340 [Mycena olivaceomarginata]
MQVKLNSHVGDDIEKWWISQQDYVRKHFQRAIGAENDYLPLRLITGINFDCILDPQVDGFTLRGTFMADVPTDQVYLFLCPSKVEFVDGRFIVMNPDNSQRYYWTFDPAGLDRLTHAEAEDIGLPTPTFLINVWGRSWSEREDDMIREFHTAKGFDPDSQDIAIAMQYPLINVEDIKTYVQQLKGDNFVKCREDKDAIEDEIYYSLALC